MRSAKTVARKRSGKKPASSTVTDRPTSTLLDEALGHFNHAFATNWERDDPWHDWVVKRITREAKGYQVLLERGRQTVTVAVEASSPVELVHSLIPTLAELTSPPIDPEEVEAVNRRPAPPARLEKLEHLLRERAFAKAAAFVAQTRGFTPAELEGAVAFLPFSDVMALLSAAPESVAWFEPGVIVSLGCEVDSADLMAMTPGLMPRVDLSASGTVSRRFEGALRYGALEQVARFVAVLRQVPRSRRAEAKALAARWKRLILDRSGRDPLSS